MIDLTLSNPHVKWTLLRDIKDQIIMKYGFVMDDVDEHKPWGAYYRFPLEQKQKFLDLFFPDLSVSEVPGEVHTKVMVFEPGKKISLQYHERRDEIWVVLYGEIEAYIGEGDELGEYTTYLPGQTFTYNAGMRHKAGASAKGCAVIAEIWCHTDQNDLSTEEDNTRVSDDYGRA